MDLRHYYQKIRETEATIADVYAIIVSHETPDGGRAGTKTEVPKRIAAKMVVEGMARLATPDETSRFREGLVEGKRLAEQAAAATRVQLTVLSNAELDRLKAGARGSKD